MAHSASRTIHLRAVAHPSFFSLNVIAGQYRPQASTLASSIAIYACPEVGECYANCDGSTIAPVLNVDDFTCFINAFAAVCQ